MINQSSDLQYASRSLMDYIWNGKQLCHEVLDMTG